MAQMVRALAEHVLVKQDVTGSIPGIPHTGEVAQLGECLAVDCKVSSSNSASAHRAKGERFLKNLSSHTVHSAECTGNCTGGLMSSFPLKRSLGRIKHCKHLLNWLD